jgi:hypothetical protein
MKILSVGLLGVLLAVGCGGASEDDGRDGEGVDTGDDDSEADDTADDDEGDDAPDDTADDSPADDSEADDSAADDSEADDSSDDDSAADDADTPDAPVPDIPPTMGSTMPRPPMVTPTPTGMAPTPIELPEEGCEVVSQSSSQGYCDLYEACATGYQSGYCSQLPTGEWSCQCSQDGSVSKELNVVGDEQPCKMVADLCGSIEVPEFTGEPTCSETYNYVGADYCNTQTRCVKSEPVNDQVSVVQSSYGGSNCYSDGLGGLSCNCSSQTASMSFGLTDVAVDMACDIGLSLCEGSGVEPVTEETCTLTYDNTGTGYCQLQQTCGATVSVDGTEATLTNPQTANCQTDSAGVTNCYCYAGNTSYSFTLGAVVDETSCDTALGVCAGGEEVVLGGPIECAVSSQSASASYCSVSTVCTQEATVGDTTVGMAGAVYTSCQPNGDVWSCQCQSGVNAATIEVASADAWDACSAAAVECEAAVEVQIGSSGSPCVGIAFQEAGPVAPAGMAAAPAGTSAPSAPPSVPGMAPIPCFR